MPCRSASAMSFYRCSLKAEGCEGQQTPKGEQGAHGSSVAMLRGLAPEIKSVTALALRFDGRARELRGMFLSRSNTVRCRRGHQAQANDPVAQCMRLQDPQQLT